jgi:thiol-disulfide isomerase/thioredoxin
MPSISSYLKPLTGGSPISITSSLKNGLSMNTLIMIVVVIIFLGIGIYVYMNYFSKASKLYSANREFDQGSKAGANAEIILFYVDWCPHCKTAKPIWEQVKAEYSNKTVNGYNVTFTEINCTNESPDITAVVDKYKIEGYPTIKLLKGDQVIDFEAKPTVSSLTQFLNTAL